MCKLYPEHVVQFYFTPIKNTKSKYKMSAGLIMMKHINVGARKLMETDREPEKQSGRADLMR